MKKLCTTIVLTENQREQLKQHLSASLGKGGWMRVKNGKKFYTTVSEKHIPMVDIPWVVGFYEDEVSDEAKKILTDVLQKIDRKPTVRKANGAKGTGQSNPGQST